MTPQTNTRSDFPNQPHSLFTKKQPPPRTMDRFSNNAKYRYISTPKTAFSAISPTHQSHESPQLSWTSVISLSIDPNHPNHSNSLQSTPIHSNSVSFTVSSQKLATSHPQTVGSAVEGEPQSYPIEWAHRQGIHHRLAVTLETGTTSEAEDCSPLLGLIVVGTVHCRHSDSAHPVQPSNFAVSSMN